jgi:hypothetical protein
MSPTAKREDCRALYEKARDLTPKNQDGSTNVADLLRTLEKIIPFDEKIFLRREAKRVLTVVSKKAMDDYDGQLHFENFGSWDWEPKRVIRSHDGKVIENQFATLKFKLADAERSNKHAGDAFASSKRKQHEYNVFSRWVNEQPVMGADREKLTWGDYVQALGIHEPPPAPPED